MARTALTSVRLTREEKARLAQLASRMHRSEADVIRRLIEKAAAKLNSAVQHERESSDAQSEDQDDLD